MTNLQFKQVDVFTSVPFRGNPVAVVFDADNLADTEMQRIAHWTNLSETVFIQCSSEADYRIRIFTPGRELPFAGHPTIGTAHAVREAGIVPRERTEFFQECLAGIIPISAAPDGILSARVPRPRIADISFDHTIMISLVGDDSCTEGVLVDVGPLWTVARIATTERLYGLHIDTKQLIELSRKTQSVGLCAYAVDEHRDVHVRAFAPAAGIFEDPVCGSGNAAVAAHIRVSGVQHIVGAEYTAYQGRALGRDGRVHVRIHGDDVFIGGHSVTVIDGQLNLQPTAKPGRILTHQ